MSATLELRQQSPLRFAMKNIQDLIIIILFVFHVISLFNSWQYIVQVQSEKQRGHFSIVYRNFLLDEFINSELLEPQARREQNWRH